jgi:tetrahedral aminopeptidase
VDIITFDAPPVDLKGDRFAAKSLDNRASVAAVTLCLYELSYRAQCWDVVAVASAQEETFGNGAAGAAYQVAPDIAIVIDGTYGAQRGVSEDESFRLGDGPTISRGPNSHPKLVRAMRDCAAEQEIALHVEPLPGHTGTDAWAIQVSRTGVPTMLISIPMRNMHSPSEVVDLRDIRRTGRLLAAFVAGLEPDFMDSLAYQLPDFGEENA